VYNIVRFVSLRHCVARVCQRQRRLALSDPAVVNTNYNGCVDCRRPCYVNTAAVDRRRFPERLAALSGCKFTFVLLVQDERGREVAAICDARHSTSGRAIKRGGVESTTGGGLALGARRARHHSTAAAATASLLTLMTSVLAATAVLVAQSVDVVLRLPTSAADSLGS